ncbi:MAG: PQQ-binding-like beta-propeller repeat protein [Marinoscillum sp.]
MRSIHLSILIIGLFALLSCASEPESSSQIDYTKWAEFQGGPDRNQYSTLAQITLENVRDLKVAWSHGLPDSGQMQMNPIIVDNVLYGIGADVRPFALNATTGERLWIHGDPLNEWHSTSRGVAYWSKGTDKRIYYSKGAYLFALDALNGELITSFADSGQLDLHKGLPESAQQKFLVSNAPGTIYNDLIIVPVRVSEGSDAAPGDIRAFNVRTGDLVWTFHTLPYPGEDGYETWENTAAYKNTNVGGINNWCGMTVDRENGILYVPLGSAAPDFYGGNRLGANLYSNCLLALDVKSGEKFWHFQFTHHDIWDRDLPSTPNLLEVTRDGKQIKAIAQITKQGYVYLFDRFTGEPLFDIEEVPFPESRLIGERAYATQPIPTKPEPFARRSDRLTADDLSPYAKNKEELLAIFRNADRRFYAPPGEDTVLLLPGYDGGGEWGGAAADPQNGVLYVNSNEMAWLLSLEKAVADSLEWLSGGEQLYVRYCASCHQKDRIGSPESRVPSLIGLNQKYAEDSLINLINKGKGMMPGFPHLTTEEKESIADYLLELETDKQEVTSVNSLNQDLYVHKGYHKFLDSDGLPAIAPPWGTLNAIDLNTGSYLWTIPLGETPELKAQGYPTTGTENYGGPAITENGLLFIAGTKDGVFRTFNRHTGELLWQYQLPAPAFATPAIYEANGKQFVVIACGGEKLGTMKGNQIVAFSL